MTIELTPENQRMLEHVLHSGGYHDAQEVITAALEALAEDAEDVATIKANEHEPRVSLHEAESQQREAAIEQLKSFGKTHRPSLGGVTLQQIREESRP